MSGRTIAVIGLALFCGLAAALGIFLLPKQQPAAVVETRPVVFAAADIQRGDVIKESMLELRQVPVDQATPGGLDKLADALDRVALMPMVKGDFISDPKLFPKGNAGDVAAQIPPGMRAYTIPMTIPGAESLVSGNRVDILYKVNAPGDRVGGAAKPMLLQYIKVLDVTPTNKNGPNTPGSVTLVVTPADATILGGQNQGDLHLILRNNNDPTVVVQKRKVAFAEADVPIGVSITQAMITFKELPLEEADQGVDPVDAINRSPRILIRKGAMILENQLFPKGFGPGLAAKIQKGMRAHTIATLSPPSRVAGFLRPGSQVDVLWTPTKKGADAGVAIVEKSVVLAQNVEILAVDTTDAPVPELKGPTIEERSVTLLVTPEQALILDQGENTGTLHLSLRLQDDALVEKKPVVFAVEDIPIGESITQSMVNIQLVPLDQAPSDGLQNIFESIGRISREPIKKGKWILESRLYVKGSTSGLAAKILPGMRAYTITTPTPPASLAGFLCRGNRVDVLWTGDDKPSELAVPLLLQNIEILAVDRTVDQFPISKDEEDEKRSVTLMVTPDEAAKLDRYQRKEKGILHLALRNPNDVDVTPEKPKVLNLPQAIGQPQADATPLVIRAIGQPQADATPLVIRTLRGTSAGEIRIIYRVLQPPPCPPCPPPPPPIPGLPEPDGFERPPPLPSGQHW